MEIKPLERELKITEASRKSLEILGTPKMYLEAEVLGGRKMIEAEVLEGEGSKKILISIDLLKKWDLVHTSFPNEAVSDYLMRMTNKTCYRAYSSLYDV